MPYINGIYYDQRIVANATTKVLLVSNGAASTENGWQLRFNSDAKVGVGFYAGFNTMPSDGWNVELETWIEPEDIQDRVAYDFQRGCGIFRVTAPKVAPLFGSSVIVEYLSDPRIGNYGGIIYSPNAARYGSISYACLLAKIALNLAPDGTYTATATPQGGTAPFLYAWTLPSDATEVTGSDNTRSFKSAGGGDVSVTVSDSDAPTPCTDTATANTSAATVKNPPTSGAIELGGYAPAITPTPENDTATQAAFAFTEPYVGDATPDDAQCAGINIARWDNRYLINNELLYRRVPPPNFTVYEKWADYSGVSNSSFGIVLPKSDVETRYEFVARGIYRSRVAGQDETFPATNPRAAQNSNGNDEYYSNSAFVTVPAATPTEPPGGCPTGQHWNGSACVPDDPAPPPPTCTLDCSFEVDDKGADLYRITAAATGAQGAVAASWKRDGAALASTTLFIEETIAINASALFECTLTDSVCNRTFKQRVSNDDENTTNGLPDAVPAAPAAPVAAKNCARSVIVVTAPALPARATSIEIARDDAPDFVMATASFDDAEAGFESRKYRARALNANGASEWSAYSAAVSLASNALSIEWLAPDEDEVLAHDTPLRFRLADAGETLNECGLPQLPDDACDSLDVNDAQVSLALGGFALDIAAQLIEGTPRNGVYEAVFDARDYSSGAHQLIARARGSDCCFARAARPVVVNNTLRDGVLYRDVFAQAPQGQVVPRARYGVEVHALSENPSRNYWMETGARSGTALDGDYGDEAWDAHQKIILEQGQHYDAQGTRIERTQWGAAIRFFLPNARQVRVRQKWSLQFALACFDTSSPVRKIRRIEAGRHLIWTGAPARALIYDGQSLSVLFEGRSHAAADALDAALVGDKLFVVNEGGELFAYDTDADDVAMNYTVRGETLPPRWIENVGGLAIALYVGEGITRAYNLAFGAPRLLWELGAAVTKTEVSGGRLLLGAGTAFYASVDGVTEPVLIHRFAVTLTSLGEKFVGFGNGDVREEEGGNWKLVLSRAGAIGGVREWRGGTTGEVAQGDARPTLGGAGPWLSSRKASGAWFDERELRVPLDLAPRAAGDVSTMDLFSVENVRVIKDGEQEKEEKTTDERLLIGTSSGLLFVYGRSLLRPSPGVIAVSRDTAVRLWPFGRVA